MTNQNKTMSAITERDSKEILKVCRFMLEAWYSGDAKKMESVLHNDLAKRGIIVDPATGA